MLLRPLSFSFALVLMSLSILVGLSTSVSPAVVAGEPLGIWLGTSAAQPSRGIYHSSLDLENGKLTSSKLAAEISGPGFLAMHPTKEVLYAVGTPIDGKPSVVAYEINHDKKSVGLRLMNAVEINDGGAAHVAVDKTGKILLTAQYGGGSVAVFRLADDGSVKERTQLVEHEGASDGVPGRQKSPHPHWVGFSPDNQYAFVPDLAMDQVVIYRVDLEKALLKPHGHAKSLVGSGPRHMKFHPNGKWVYVLNEITLSVTMFLWDAQAGTLEPKQTIPTVPQEEAAKEQARSASEIRIHPSGKFAYSANRGHDTITAYRIDQESGELSVIEVENNRGATPRNFNLTPDGKWLLSASQDSHTLGVFVIDQATGELTYNRSIISTPSPICVLFQPGS